MVRNIALFLALLMMISSMGRSLTVPAEYDGYYKELNRNKSNSPADTFDFRLQTSSTVRKEIPVI